MGFNFFHLPKFVLNMQYFSIQALVLFTLMCSADNKSLPFMAMLRNLRNMITQGISEPHHKQILDRLTNKVRECRPLTNHEHYEGLSGVRCGRSTYSCRDFDLNCNLNLAWRFAEVLFLTLLL